MSSSIEELTRRFYLWEVRGRGFLQWPRPVRLEPPFRPFFGHYLPSSGPVVDDGRREGIFSQLFGPSSNSQALTHAPHPDEDEPEPEFDRGLGVLTHFTIGMPESTRLDRDAAEAFLLSLQAVSSPISFEIAGQPDAITVQFTARPADAFLLRDQLRAFFPGAAAAESADALKVPWSVETGYFALVECALAREFMLPLRTFARMDPDPLLAAYAAMESLGCGESGVIQVLLEPTREDWARSVIAAVTDGQGGPFFADAPDLTRLAFEKVSHPLYAAVLRIGATAPTNERATEILRRIAGSLVQLGRTDGNEFTVAANETDADLEIDLLARTSHRSGMLLSSGELLSLVHPPSASVTTSKLLRRMRATRAAPDVVCGQGIGLGTNEHAGVVRRIALSPEERMRHVHVVGASGTGKSNLLLDLALQIIGAGEGMALLDPHGDLVDEVLGRIPEDREEEVVLVDAGDAEHPVGFNLLDAHSEIERTLLASDLVAVFRRLSTTWGDQMNAVLANAIQAFLTSTTGGTIADLRRFLIEPEYRREFLKTVDDEEVVYYWTKEFPLLVGKPAGPILTRLDGFLRPKPLRAMLGQKESRLDFREILDRGRILLVKLAQGAIGEENSALLGSLMVAKLHQAAISRQDMAREVRREFTLVMDEFQELVTPSVERILAGTRKYRLGLVAAHQAMRPVFEADPAVASALLANAATRIVFRVGEDDAKKLAEGFAHFEARDLTSLGVGEAICRIGQSDHDFNLKTRLMPAMATEDAARRRLDLVERSRSRYAPRLPIRPTEPATPASGATPPNVKMARQEPPPELSDAKRLKDLIRSVSRPKGPKQGV